MEKHVTSRMLTCAGGPMSVSGVLMAVCSRPAYGGILFASAACMFRGIQLSHRGRPEGQRQCKGEYEP